MDILDAALTNLRTPAVLAFAIGVVATLIKGDVKLPDPVAQAISMYLLVAIGAKGGVAIAEAGISDVIGPAAGTLALGVVTPVIAFGAFRHLGRYGVVDAAALAAHYGSVSLVTFAASLTFLDRLEVTSEGFLPGLLALLEVPAIVISLMIAKRLTSDRDGPAAGGMGHVVRHAFTERSVLLLVGGLLIGGVGGTSGWDKIEPFFGAPFNGVLTLFLLQMGVVAAAQLRGLRSAGFRLVLFAVAIPVVHGALGAAVGSLVGLSPGGATVLAAMAASASYIAAPAAVSMALPQANPAIYLTAALGITFPFNVALGIPLYHEIALLVT
jgi:hypothetical protein